MFTSVIVPLDGSPDAEVALGPATELSARLDVPLVLFHAAGDDRAEVEAYLDRVAGRVGDRPVTSVVHGSFASCGLADIVESRAGAVVCMTPQLAAPPGAELGPVAEDLLARGDAPVVLVGPASGGGRVVRRHTMVVCADGSSASCTVEPLVAETAALLGLDVAVVTVLDEQRPDLAGLSLDSVRRRVRSLAFCLERDGIEVHVEELHDRHDPAFAITHYAASHAAAMIATSARGHRHDLYPVLGDTVLHLVRLSPVPVLVSQPLTAA